MLGVFQGEPVPNKEPPEGAEYHRMLPLLAEAESETAPTPHLSPGVELLTVGIAVTVAVTAVLEAEVQEPFTA